MAIDPYRRVLALPGVRMLFMVAVVARIPMTATGIALTLHVVNGLHLGFAQAGLVGAANTIGVAVGSPVIGRFVDRRGLRPVMAVTTIVQLVFWTLAPWLPYGALLVSAFICGLFCMPVWGAVRQCLGAMIPPESTRTAFVMDSMLTEVSYMIGPALAVAAVTMFGSLATMTGLGVALVGAGVAIFSLNPPTRSHDEEAGAEPVARRAWLRGGLVALFGGVAALTFVLTATELAIVATLRSSGDTAWSGLVIGLWCGYSMFGGFVYGALSRGTSPLLLIGGLCALTVPVGLVGGGWWWLCLALIPSGVLCAPAMSSIVDAINKVVPAAVRGEAMGLHGTALTVGIAVAAPVAGAIVDNAGPSWAFASCGVIGLLAVLAAMTLARSSRARALALSQA
ncbi:MFS transporter [Streptosporangiaceae bacterium NEAU-GS5]|nr:MFS transporter [Streptosporangiaceae bacterium NEAU-GS5]